MDGESTGGDKQTFEDEAKENMIGKTITGYVPIFNAEADVKGGTIAEGKYTPEDKYTGRESSDTEQGKFETESLGWKIWSIDDNNIYLILATPTTTTLTLRGSEGYNNGVLILNEICKTCYTDSRYNGVEVRSINAKDMEKVITAPIDGTAYGTTPYEYEFKYPNAYWEYDKEKGELENRSNQDEVITGVLEKAQTTSPMNTYYFKTNFDPVSGGTWTNEVYADFFGSSASWVASRWVSTSSRLVCEFGLNIVSHNWVSGNYLYWCNNGYKEREVKTWAVRPLVSIPLTSCDISGPNKQDEYSLEARNY